jgi:hypothetical protein
MQLEKLRDFRCMVYKEALMEQVESQSWTRAETLEIVTNLAQLDSQYFKPNSLIFRRDRLMPNFLLQLRLCQLRELIETQLSFLTSLSLL